MKIGFLCFHPGSVNTVTKVIKELKENEKCDLYYYPFIDYALKEWGIEGHNVYQETEDFFDSVEKDLDILVYSPAAGSFIEDEVPEFCRSNNILSIGTIDIFWLEEKEIKRRFKNVPDIIITPEQSIKKMIDNFNWECDVLNLGNPHLEVKKVHNGDFKENNKVLNYISFPCSNALKCDTDEFSKEIMRELSSIIEHDTSIDTLYISTHPRENTDFVEHLMKFNNKIQLNPFRNTDEACDISDIIIGHNSTVLYEQMLKGKPVVFYKNKEELKRSIMSKKIENNVDFVLPKNCAKNIAKLIIEKGD